MPSKKPNKKAKVPLNESSGLSGVSDTQAAEENAMESGASQVNHSVLSVLIRSIIRKEIGAAFEKFQPQLDALKGELDSCCQKLCDMEEGITDMDCRVAILETANGNLMNENKEFKDKIERMEIQSRKFNLRVIGLKTDIEKSDPIAFVTNFLKEVFGSELSCEPAVEIASRIGQGTDLRPRPMIVTMQRYQAKEDILKLARSKGEIIFRDMRVNIFPDITPDIARKRALFNDVRMKLRKAEVRHGLLFPATLIVTFNGQTKLYRDCSEAEHFYKTVISPVSVQTRNEGGK